MGLFQKLFRKGASMLNIDINIPKCFSCGKALQCADSIFEGGHVTVIGSKSVQELQDDYTLFRGIICFKCKTVLCMECVGGVLQTCPQCQGQAEPAYRRHLLELSKLLSSDICKSESLTTSSSKFSDIRLVMALSRAVQQKFKDYPPEIVAAVMLAMTEKNRNDLVERPEGIYLSRQCADRISSFEVWLADDGDLKL